MWYIFSEVEFKPNVSLNSLTTIMPKYQMIDNQLFKKI